MRRWLSMLWLAVLAACASAPPPQPDAMPALRIAPAEAGRTLSLAQRLTIESHGRTQTVEAVLEVDAQRLDLVMLQFGQPVARLSWDGRTLSEQRLPALPAAVSAQRILTDLQLMMWPVEAVARALPAPWHVSQHDAVRELTRDADVVARVRYASDADAQLDNLREGYRLRVESVPLAP